MGIPHAAISHPLSRWSWRPCSRPLRDTRPPRLRVLAGRVNVFTPDGKLAGTNSIEREIGGCVLHERYETAKGYRGESFNVYDAARRVWHQTWVDNQGLLLVVEAGSGTAAWCSKGALPAPTVGSSPTASPGPQRRRHRAPALADERPGRHLEHGFRRYYRRR